MTRDEAIRLLYRAPVTLPARSSGSGRLRKAPTTVEELQNPQLLAPKLAATHPERMAQTGKSEPAQPEPEAPAASDHEPSTVTHLWSVRLLGTARLSKARMALDTLPATFSNCSLHTSELGELAWHEIRCGSFANRKQAQTWLNGMSIPDALVPAVIRVKDSR